MTTIGFFGDSFCSEISNAHSVSNHYTTYIKQLADHYHADVVHLGVPGSGIWDAMLLQFMPFKDSPPDISVFVWSGPGRLFHRTNRSVTFSTASANNPDPVLNAANEYYTHLFDSEKAELEHTAALMYFDSLLLQIPNTKIIHLWAFGLIPYTLGKTNLNVYQQVAYNHDFKSGVEIRPPLMTLSADVTNTDIIKVLKNDTRANHLAGAANDVVFNWIKSAIDSFP